MLRLMIEAEEMFLPPGFRFHPTDEELITHYLAPKVAGTSFCATVIGELDLNKREPWDLPLSTKVGDEWYFFCMKDRKYPTGLRTSRATDSGHWKATGKDKEIHRRRNLIGMKKTLVFYKGRAPKGEKTNWVMHEYRLEGNQSNTEQVFFFPSPPLVTFSAPLWLLLMYSFFCSSPPPPAWIECLGDL
ncbi:hypothetical protein C4D60_Mb07t17760 [Musa balbisiana]|uniref:NAC domain-containing protein n=1 Tax=Musa balbisiana TaxID=52838 RepID=A0A4V4H6R0_MUSBA|nr:hypothetical protein C4D60_Mb07t17760 [Musa balbisiana]